MDTTVPAGCAGTLFCPRCGRRFGADAGFCAEDGTALLAVGGHGDLAGTVLKGKYVLVRLLGRGAFGSVYHAFHVLARTDVAVKVLHGDFRRDPRLRKHVLKEARAVMGMKSPHAVVVHDVDEDDRAGPFIVMEVFDGQPLDDYARSIAPGTGRLPPGEVVRLSLQICDALDEAHAKGVVHRDLKPSNILVVRDRDGRAQAKVVDFGIACVAPTPDADAASGLAGTAAGAGLAPYGTRQVDGRADLHALGAIMYELCNGRAPCPAAGPRTGLVDRAAGRWRTLARRLKGPKVPAALERLIVSLLKKPDQRPVSAAAVMAELRAIRVPTATRPARVRAWAWVGIVVAAIALAGMVGWRSFRPRVPAVVDSPKAGPKQAPEPPVEPDPESPAGIPRPRDATLVPEPPASGRREAASIPPSSDLPDALVGRETAPATARAPRAPKKPRQESRPEGQRSPPTPGSQVGPTRTPPAVTPGGEPSIWEVFD